MGPDVDHPERRSEDPADRAPTDPDGAESIADPGTDDPAALRALLRESRESERRLRQQNRAWRTLYLKKKEELSRARERIADLRRRRSDFLNSVSHDLRTPLTTILSSSEFLLSGAKPPPKSEECLEAIRSEGEKLNRVIEDIFAFTKVGGDDLDWMDEAVDVGKIAAAVAGKRDDSPGPVLTWEIEPDLPPARVDPNRLEGVFRFLIARTLRNAPAKGEGKLRVDRAPPGGGGELHRPIRVSIGIEEEARRGGRVLAGGETPAARSTEGEWGLAVCRDVITHYGGDLWFEGGEGGGRILFTLPPAGSPARVPEGKTGAAPESVSKES